MLRRVHSFDDAVEARNHEIRIASEAKHPFLGATLQGGRTLGYALAFSTSGVAWLYRRARRWIELALGVFFCLAGIKLLTSRS